MNPFDRTIGGGIQSLLDQQRGAPMGDGGEFNFREASEPVMRMAEGGYTNEQVAQALQESMGQGFTFEQSLQGATDKYGISPEQLIAAQSLLSTNTAKNTVTPDSALQSILDGNNLSSTLQTEFDESGPNVWAPSATVGNYTITPIGTSTPEYATDPLSGQYVSGYMPQLTGYNVDNKGLWTAPDGTQHAALFTNTYDAAGNKTSQTINVDWGGANHSVLTYDASGKLVDQRSYNDSGGLGQFALMAASLIPSPIQPFVAAYNAANAFQHGQTLAGLAGLAGLGGFSDAATALQVANAIQTKNPFALASAAASGMDIGGTDIGGIKISDAAKAAQVAAALASGDPKKIANAMAIIGGSVASGASTLDESMPDYTQDLWPGIETAPTEDTTTADTTTENTTSPWVTSSTGLQVLPGEDVNLPADTGLTTPDDNLLIDPISGEPVDTTPGTPGEGWGSTSGGAPQIKGKTPGTQVPATQTFVAAAPAITLPEVPQIALPEMLGLFQSDIYKRQKELEAAKQVAETMREARQDETDQHVVDRTLAEIKGGHYTDGSVEGLLNYLEARG